MMALLKNKNLEIDYSRIIQVIVRCFFERFASSFKNSLKRWYLDYVLAHLKDSRLNIFVLVGTRQNGVKFQVFD